MSSDEYASARMSIRSALLVSAALLGVLGGLALIAVALSRPTPSTTTLILIAIAALSAASLVPFLALRPEVQLVAKNEQIAALRRMVSSLQDRTPPHHNPLDSAQLDVKYSQLGSSESMSIEVFFADQLIVTSKTTVIVGPPGSGKTAFLTRLAAQVASRTHDGNGSYWPLYASAISWSPDSHLSSWLESDMSQFFGIRRRVTSAWLRSRHKILFVDAFDELESDDTRRHLLLALKAWQSKPYGGKLVITTREEEFEIVSKLLEADRIASIRPIGVERLQALMRKILTQSDVFAVLSSDRRRLDHQLDFLRAQLVDGGLNTPSEIIRALEKSATSNDISGTVEAASSENRQLLQEADSSLGTPRSYPEAVQKYLRVASSANPEIGAVALMRATLVQAAIGEIHEAESGFDRALEQFKDLNPLVQDLDAVPLEVFERGILRAMQDKRPQLEAEIVAGTGIAPSSVREGLKSLMAKGFVFTREVGTSRTQFYESALNRRTDAIGLNESPPRSKDLLAG